MSIRLSDLANEVRISYTPSKDEELPYIGLENVQPNTLQLSFMGTSLDVQSNKFRFKAGDILFGTLRPYFRKVILAPCDGVCSTEFSVLRPKHTDDHHYVFYSVAHPAFISYATANSKGARPRTKWQLFSDYELPAFSLHQRRYIGNILSAYDDLIENNRRRIQLLEQAARLLYREWFVHLRFPGHEHTKILDGVPEGWERKPLGELITLQRGFDLPVSRRKEGPFPIYASTGINGYHAEAKVKGPGVVTGRSGSLGTVMYVSGDFWPLNTTLWVKEFKLVGSHYAKHLLASMQLEQYNGGAAVPTLNRNDVHRVEVLNPPSIVLQMFEDQSHHIAKQIDVLTSMNLKLAEARDFLLPKLMRGKVVV